MKIANRPVMAELWVEFRGRFIASISKTIWRYHEDNIVDASVFGTPIKKSNVGQGFHRDVAEAFKLVEKSALRLSGKSTIAELKSAEGAEGKDTGARKNPITLPGTHSGSSRCRTRAGCASTGSSARMARAGRSTSACRRIRRSAQARSRCPLPDLTDRGHARTRQVQHRLGKLRRQAGAVAPLMRQRAGLEELAKTEDDPIAQGVIKESLARVDELIRQQVVDSPASKELRKDAEAALDKLNA